MLNLDYKGMADRMKDLDNNDDNSNSHHGPDGLDGRATLVPPAGGGFPTLQVKPIVVKLQQVYTHVVFQMLNIMERMKENERKGEGGPSTSMASEISLTPMNLSTMLSRTPAGAKAGPDLASLVPIGGGGNANRQSRSSREGSVSPKDMTEEDDDEAVEGPAAAAARAAAAAAAADIRAQFMADLRRLGGNIPVAAAAAATSSEDGEKGEKQVTTTSSDPPRPSSPPSASSSSSTTRDEESLPPRKRKVSQEHHHSLDSDRFINGLPAAPNSKEAGSPTNNSNSSSPEKTTTAIGEGDVGSSSSANAGLQQECRN